MLDHHRRGVEFMEDLMESSINSAPRFVAQAFCLTFTYSIQARLKIAYITHLCV